VKTGIYLQGGKNTPLIQRVVGILDKHLGAAIAGGRETVACAIVSELSKVSGVNRNVFSNCVIGDNTR
jgi:hypothetical protein